MSASSAKLRVRRPYGGHAASRDDTLIGAFTEWVTAVRFDPAVVAARVRLWHQQAGDALAEAVGAAPGDRVAATRLLRESARALRLVLIERWGGRLGSMGREWTHFERMADHHGARRLATRIAVLAGADVRRAAPRAARAPAWLKERVDLCYGARRVIGEEVTADENARDQLAAFAVHVARHRPDLDGAWTDTPDPDLDEHLAELGEILAQLR